MFSNSIYTREKFDKSLLKENEKYCSKCNTVKDKNEFSKNKDTKDNLSFYCKSCNNFTNKLKYSVDRIYTIYKAENLINNKVYY